MSENIYDLCVEDFINENVMMLKNSFSEDQIKENVLRYVLAKSSPNLRIDTYAKKSMGLYAEIILEFSKYE